MTAYIAPGIDATVSPEKIEAIVCEVFGINRSWLLSKKQSPDYSHPRMIAIAMIRKFTDMESREICRRYGKKDKSTLSHSYKFVREVVPVDKTLKAKLLHINNEIETIKRHEAGQRIRKD